MLLGCEYFEEMINQSAVQVPPATLDKLYPGKKSNAIKCASPSFNHRLLPVHFPGLCTIYGAQSGKKRCKISKS